jgi:putative phosphotransacetylase
LDQQVRMPYGCQSLIARNDRVYGFSTEGYVSIATLGKEKVEAYALPMTFDKVYGVTADNVAVLGPTRDATQVEISATDARTLGISAPVRLSGDLKDAADVAIQAGGTVITRKAAIVAKRHLHMTPEDAAAFGVQHGQSVSVRVLGSRPLILEDVPVRVSRQAALALHMDTDEANAAGAGKDCACQIVGVGCSAPAVCEAGSAPAPAPVLQPECRTLPGKLITEQDVKKLCRDGARSLCLAKGQIITPLARDTAKSLGLNLTYGG